LGEVGERVHYSFVWHILSLTNTYCSWISKPYADERVALVL